MAQVVHCILPGSHPPYHMSSHSSLTLWVAARGRHGEGEFVDLQQEDVEEESNHGVTASCMHGDLTRCMGSHTRCSIAGEAHQVYLLWGVELRQQAGVGCERQGGATRTLRCTPCDASVKWSISGMQVTVSDADGNTICQASLKQEPQEIRVHVCARIHCTKSG